MPQPYNYMLNLPNPSDAITGALQIGANIDALKARQIATQQAQVKFQQQQEMQKYLSELSQNPTAAGITQAVVKYPQLSEHYKRAYDMLNTTEKDTRINQASQVYAALEAGKPEIAQKVLQEQIQAYKNSGREQDAQALETMAETIKVSPNTAKTTTGLFLASAMGDKFGETFGKLQAERRATALEPSQLTEAQAKAQKAATEADFAESEAVMDLQKKGWDVAKIQNDIGVSKENQKIALAKLQLDREQNQLKKDELKVKIDELKRKRDEEIRQKAANAESARTTIDNMLSTADRIINTPMDVIADATGPVESRLPTLYQSTADFEALIENFDAQAFIAQIPAMKGSGSLSDAEGKRLSAALQSISLKQSPEQLVKNIKEAQRLMLKARSTLAKKYGVPDTMPDTPEVKTSPEDIESLINQYTTGQYGQGGGQ